MPTGEEMVHGINVGFEAAQLKEVAIKNGMRTLHQDGMLKVKAGLTSIEECMATVPPDLEGLEVLRQNDPKEQS